MDRFVFHVTMVFAVVFISKSGRVDSKVCWDKTWYNNSNPINGSEYESLTKSELAKICPNGPVIDAQCADDKHAGFSGNKSWLFVYVASCSVANGLVCHPFKNIFYACPDMAIQYGCECPTNTSSSATGFISSTVPGNKITKVLASTGSPADPDQRQNTNVPDSTGSNVDPNQRQNTKVPASTGSNVDPNQRQNTKVPASTGSNVDPNQRQNTKVPAPTGSNVDPNQRQNTKVPASTGSPVDPNQRQNTKVPASTGSPVDPSQHKKQSEDGHNNGIKNVNPACLLLVLLLVNSLY